MKVKMISSIVMTLMSINIIAQEITIKGHITSATDKMGIPGATVVVKGTTIGTVADVDGNYQIVANAKQVLVFSFVGSTTQEVAINGRDVINIELKDDVELNEVVVVGYGTMKKSDVTGAVGSIKPDQLTKMSSSDVSQSLSGRLAGVNVTANSGEPGAGAKVRIRGTGTINNSDPLYVVDGFPVADIKNIAPYDILSMEVLKDASATAIYGSRGANGVILIKTKTGKVGQKTQVNFNVYGGVSEVHKKLDLLNAHEFATLKSESIINGGGTISESNQAMFDYVIDNQSEGTDWQNEIMRVAVNQNYNLSIAGGGDKNSFDAGITYSKDQGTIKNTYQNKLIARLNNEYKLSDKVTMGANISVSNIDRSQNNADFTYGSLTQAIKADPISAAWDDYTNNFGQLYFTYGGNPAMSAYENQFANYQENRFNSNVYINVEDLFAKGLSLRAQYGYQLSSGHDKNYSPQYYITASQQRQQSSLYEKRSETKSTNATAYLNYAKTFDTKHSLNLMLGTEQQKFKSEYMSASAMDVPMDENLWYLSSATNKQQYTVDGTANESALLSYFARGNYSYDNKYYLTTTVRADGSSKFKNKWGYFPSFSFGWNLLQEDFMAPVSEIMSALKLRAGWGMVGNESSAGYNDYVALMTNGYTYVFGGNMVDGSVQQMLANDELTWETSEQYNVGVDFGFLNNALTGTVDYFIRNTNNMILSTPLPMYAGMWRTRTNAGSMQNKGVELSLNYKKEIHDFTIDAGFNISTAKNTVTSIGGSDPIPGGTVGKIGSVTLTEVGSEIGYFYGYKTDGIFKSQQEIDSYVNNDGKPLQPQAAPGDVKFVDENHDGKIDEHDRTYLGSAMPKFTYGFNLGFGYKAFDLSLFFQGSQGNKAANAMYQVLYSSSMSEWSGSQEMMGRWTPENPTSDLPRLTSVDPNNNVRFSDRYVEDASFLRVKNIQLGYTLPQVLSQKMKIQRLRLYVSADNVFVFTKYRGYDPEIGDLYGDPLSPGVDLGNYPLPRIFTFGCNINF